MNTTTTVDETETNSPEMPGAQLAAVRLQKGYGTEYVAGKLHLRVRIIELLEADDYQNMPEPVFIKGYFRAYAKLLGVPADPLIEVFDSLYSPQRKLEKALWQSRRETYRAEHAVRWLTTLFAIGVLISVAIWWYKNKDNAQIFPATISSREATPNKSETEIRLTDLSKMRSLLSSSNQYNTTQEQTSE